MLVNRTAWIATEHELAVVEAREVQGTARRVAHGGP
jgi:hypothetical protein